MSEEVFCIVGLVRHIHHIGQQAASELNKLHTLAQALQVYGEFTAHRAAADNGHCFAECMPVKSFGSMEHINTCLDRNAGNKRLCAQRQHNGIEPACLLQKSGRGLCAKT